ncbi:unnamed protein product, partial [Durusdinium trenchii]
GAELVARRLQVIREAHRISPSAPDYTAADDFMGWGWKKSSQGIDSALSAHVATELKNEASIAKEARKVEDNTQQVALTVAKFSIFQVLDDIGREFIEDPFSMIDFCNSPKDLITPFFVRKQNNKQRFILDCRGVNRRFQPPPPLAMAAGSAWARVGLRQEDTLYIAQSDIKEYFYSLALPDNLNKSLFCLPPVPHELLQAWGVDYDKRCEAAEGGWVWPGLRVIPMGWSWAMWLSQRVHANICLQETGLSFERVLVDGNPCPDLSGGEVALLPYADILNVLGIDQARVQAVKDKIVGGLRRVGFIVHEELEACSIAQSLGFLIDGSSGVVTPIPERLDRVVKTFAWLAKRMAEDHIEPQMTRPPLPWSLVALIVTHMIHKQYRQAAAAALLMFTAYLRPGEALSLHVQDLVPPLPQQKHFALQLHPAERREQSKVGLSDESLLLDAQQAPWLGRVLLNLERASPYLIDLTYEELGTAWRKTLERIGLAQRHAVLYQLRHSGPSHDRLLRLRSLLEVKQRGRWASDKTLNRYEAHGRISQEFFNLPQQIQNRAIAAERRLQVEGPRLFGLSSP